MPQSQKVVELLPPPDRSAETARAASLVREHREALLALARRLCRHESDAGDLVQDTFERALRRADSLEQVTHPRAWLVAILHNLFIDRCRAHTPERGPQVEQLVERLPAAEPEPEPAWASITVDQIREALAKINRSFRQVFELHELEGLPYKAIALRLGIPTSTVGTRLIRGRRQLKELLLPADPDPGP
jgi:RNA polymerase sigma-70 factor (ECF subfamily)